MQVTLLGCAETKEEVNGSSGGELEDEAEVKEILETLSQIWGSQERAYDELNSIVSAHNQELFNSMLPPVNIAVVTRWMLSGPFGGSGHAAATYNPASSGMPANIFLGRLALASKEKTTIIIAHEMIHHWEETAATESEPAEYSDAIRRMIAECYGDTTAGKRWRVAHSDRFIAKANRIALQKDWDVGDLLTGESRRAGP